MSYVDMEVSDLQKSLQQCTTSAQVEAISAAISAEISKLQAMHSDAAKGLNARNASAFLAISNQLTHLHLLQGETAPRHAKLLLQGR